MTVEENKNLKELHKTLGIYLSGEDISHHDFGELSERLLPNLFDALIPILSEPIKTEVTDQRKYIEKIVFEALGEVSMCWEPKPSSQVFDSTNAKRIGDKLVFDISSVLSSPQPATLKQVEDETDCAKLRNQLTPFYNLSDIVIKSEREPKLFPLSIQEAMQVSINKKAIDKLLLAIENKQNYLLPQIAKDPDGYVNISAEEMKYLATRFVHECRLKGAVTNNDTCNLYDSFIKEFTLSAHKELSVLPDKNPDGWIDKHGFMITREMYLTSQQFYEDIKLTERKAVYFSPVLPQTSKVSEEVKINNAEREIIQGYYNRICSRNCTKEEIISWLEDDLATLRMDTLLNDSNEILSSANKETDAINFAEWVLKSDWQMHKGEWQLRAGNLTFGILKEVNTTEGLYSLYKTGKNGNDK